MTPEAHGPDLTPVAYHEQPFPRDVDAFLGLCKTLLPYVLANPEDRLGPENDEIFPRMHTLGSSIILVQFALILTAFELERRKNPYTIFPHPIRTLIAGTAARVTAAFPDDERLYTHTDVMRVISANLLDLAQNPTMTEDTQPLAVFLENVQDVAGGLRPGFKDLVTISATRRLLPDGTWARQVPDVPGKPPVFVSEHILGL